MKSKVAKITSIIVLIFVTIIGIRHQIEGGGPAGSPSVDAMCAFGGIETLYSFLASGELLKRVEMSSLVLLLAVAILSIFLGRAFCGFICPLGTLQRLMASLGHKMKIRQVKLNKNLDKTLRFSKYVVLAGILLLTYRAGSLVIRPYDPWAAYMHLSTGAEVFSESLVGVVILIILLLSSLFVERAWCRYFCPLGAALSLISPLSLFKVRRNSSSCSNCNLCSRNCPMGIQANEGQGPSSRECIKCGQCVETCPKSGTMEIKRGSKVVSMTQATVASVMLIALVIGANAALGTFKTSSPNKQVLMENGMLRAENIKGYMTLNDVCKEFNIQPEALLKKCNLPQDADLDKPLKDLSKECEQKGIDFETDKLREVVMEMMKK